MSRTSGILLHPTSLPGPHGIGTLGPEATRFAGFLASTGQSWWQMLPVGPTGYGDSPYQSPSTFAGNPLLIDLDMLVGEGLIPAGHIDSPPPFAAASVDFGSVIPWKSEILAKVARDFPTAGAHLGDGFESFREEHGAAWLDDFALFTALKRRHDLRPWWEWEKALVRRRPRSLAAARRRLRDAISAVEIEQFLFELQFQAIRAACHSSGVRLVGDVPIFVAHDSSDVWANPDLFHLNEEGLPTVVAGVPPDYFSATGQRWGNPLYRWDRHIDSGFEWWTRRMDRAFHLFDLVRVDHFRGFAASWHIPAEQPTAEFGQWVEAPGTELFDHLTSVFGPLPVIAEDLGVITDDVVALRDRYGFPGMKILQFGFGAESHHALTEFRSNVVAFTGTHDNDTSQGWLDDPAPERIPERSLALETLERSGDGFVWDLIRAVMASVADTAMIPMQDVLGLGTEARMNTPATTSGNWGWRFTWDQLTPELVERLRAITERTGRAGNAGKEG
jgi:4-alpha-glucanotransferase